MKADIRSVLMVVVVARMFADTFQFGSLVRPPFVTNGLLKEITEESKVKSPWNPTKLAPLVVLVSISEEVTGIRTTPDGEGAIVAIGRDTVTGTDGQLLAAVAVAVGVNVAVAVTVGVEVAVAVADGVNVAVAVAVGVEVDVAVAVGVNVAAVVAVGDGDAPPGIVTTPFT
jgi:hypothetical protein